MKYLGTWLLITITSLLHEGLSFVPIALTPSTRSCSPGFRTSYNRAAPSRGGSWRHHRHLQASTNWFAQFLPKPGVTKKKGQNAEVLKLKQRLLEKARFTQRGISTSAEQRQDIDALITALEPFNPDAGSVSSNLSALWILKWTTEREILFLMEKGLLGLPSGPVQQAIDVNARTLSNKMLFGPDSLFEVASSIDPEDSGPRVNFEFKACKVKYRGFTVPLPPVGKGWFESVYLDSDFRVTRDVRGDVTILVKSELSP